jgi:ferritin-like protein
MTDHTAGELRAQCDELEPTLAEIDVDGALQEAAADVSALTRGDLFRRSATAAGAGAFGFLALADGDADAAVAKTRNDIAILRFDQVLEYLQAGLYTEAERLGALSPRTLAWARVVGAHERAHLRAIKNLLGPHAVKSPGFDYGRVTADESAFLKTAVAFEDATAALLKWQAPRLDSRHIVAAAVSLHSVETRHAAWIRHLVGLQPAARAFDKPAPQHKMAQLIDSTHFLASQPTTAAKKKRPRYTG